MAVSCLYALTNSLGEALGVESDVDSAELEVCLQAANRRLIIAMQQIRDQKQGCSSDSLVEITHVDITSQMLIFKGEFEKLVSLWELSAEGRRVVIFVDDLDRIRPARALELLEAIKNFIDVPGCVFVMALDYDAIQRGMVEKLGLDLQKTSGKAFFDKMIQLPFIMPTTSYRLDDYIMGLLNKSGLPCVRNGSWGPESREFFLDITSFTVGRNPRSIKRVINYTHLLERIHHHNAGRDTTDYEYKILFALASMQIAWPEFFQHLIRDPSVDAITSLQSWA